MTVALLVLHGLSAVLLIGAMTHQFIGLCWSHRGPRDHFLKSVRAVRISAYPTAVVALYVVTFIFGTIIYPDFRVSVRTVWDIDLPAATGSFEIKEHFAAVGIAMLPAYWAAWRSDIAADQRTAVIARVALTSLLTLVVWSDFLLGHVLNNIQGL